jgi:hypothetical protein
MGGHDEGYSRNRLCALNSVSTFLLRRASDENYHQLDLTYAFIKCLYGYLIYVINIYRNTIT